MPVEPNPRLSAFDAALKRAGIPISGVSHVGPAYADVTINFLPEATAEQQTQAEEMRTVSFDWRPRRALTRTQIVSGITALTTAQQNALLRHVLAHIARGNLGELVDIVETTGLPLAVDEVIP